MLVPVPSEPRCSFALSRELSFILAAITYGHWPPVVSSWCLNQSIWQVMSKVDHVPTPSFGLYIPIGICLATCIVGHFGDLRKMLLPKVFGSNDGYTPPHRWLAKARCSEPFLSFFAGPWHPSKINGWNLQIIQLKRKTSSKPPFLVFYVNSIASMYGIFAYIYHTMNFFFTKRPLQDTTIFYILGRALPPSLLNEICGTVRI